MAGGIKLDPVPATFSLQDHVCAVLRQAILDMDIYGGEVDLRLDERSLAEQLNISRTPLRATLLRLEQEGFIDIQPRRGVFVVRKSLTEILDMITVWAALESMAARLAATTATDRELAELRATATRFSIDKASANIAEYSENNIAFHQAILALAKSPMLKDIADGLFLHMRAVRRRAMAEDHRSDRSVADHMEIIEALESRDPERASRAVRDHTLRLHDHVRRTWSRLGLEKFSDPAPRSRSPRIDTEVGQAAS